MIIDIEFWKKYARQETLGALTGYVMASNDLVRDLEQMLETKDDFKKLKKELLKFIDERKKFVEFANNNRPIIPNPSLK